MKKLRPPMHKLRWILPHLVATAFAAQLACGGAAPEGSPVEPTPAAASNPQGSDSTAVVTTAAVAPATGVTVTASLPSPEPAGTAVTFTAAGIGSTGYEYRFWLWSGGVATLVQDFGATATWTLPATTPAGDYVVQADVRTSTTTFAEPIAGRDAFVQLPFTMAAPFATGITLTPSAPTPHLVGTAVTFTAAGQASSGYQYRFWLWTNGVPALVQDFGPSATWTLPATTAVGSYVVQADVRTNASTFAQPIAGRDAFVQVPFDVVNPFATGVTLTASAPSPSPTGQAVTFTAAGQGSTGYEYRFWLWSNNIPTLVQDFGPSATWSLPPTTPPGSYIVQADVRTSTTAFAEPIAARDAWVKLPFSVVKAPAPTIAAITPRSGPVAGGTTVVVTGTGFQPGVEVIFGAFPQTIVSVTPTAITLVTVPGIIGGCKNCTGLVDVVVKNPDLQQVQILGGFTFF